MQNIVHYFGCNYKLFGRNQEATNYAELLGGVMKENVSRRLIHILTNYGLVLCVKIQYIKNFCKSAAVQTDLGS